MPPAVSVQGLSKSFRVPSEQVHTLKERVLHPLRAHRDERFEALRDVSFDVEPGEFFGIVGRNGSGKSTLLKCLAGIYRADDGAAWIDGRLSAFIELGVGFNMDLAARDNIRINAVMLGLSGRQARGREDEIIAFAGLEQFQDLKIKNYSSGMLVRLGFAIMAHVDADVLLIDEVLAVGDAAFQQKCYDQFNRIRDEGRTVLFVTHDMGAVERYCDRAMLLEKGEIVAMGKSHRVGQEYLRVNFADLHAAPEEPPPSEDGEEEAPTDASADEPEEPSRLTDGRAEIVRAWFEDSDGSESGALPHGSRCAFAAVVRFNEQVEHPLFGFVLQNDRDQTVFAASTAWTEERSGVFGAGDEVTYRVRFENVFSGGRYFATPAVAHRGAGIAWIDRREKFASTLVTSTRSTDAAVDIPYEIDLVPA
ncbi:MAG TPA: ABC transporter ATP-binding protein [Solirubrobacteraceae bacterium]